MVVVVTPGKYGGLAGRERSVRKSPKLPKNYSWTLNIKGTEEGHKTGTGSPAQEAHYQ